VTGVSLAIATSVTCLVVAPTLLRSWRRFDTYPRVGLAVWSALVILGWLSAIVLFLRVGLGESRGSLVSGLGSFAARLGDGHPLRGLGFREVVGLSLAFDVLLLMLGSLIRTGVTIAFNRRRHRSLVDLVAGHSDALIDVCVLAHPQPLPYCLPGGGGGVVVTQGAVDVLSSAELEAVVAHERGHHHGRHGAWLISLQALSPFVQFIPLARWAPTTVRMYLEMSADDFARRQVHRSALEGALGKVSLFSAAPLGAMGLTNDFSSRRLERLATSSPYLLDLAVVVAVVSASLSLVWSIVLGHL
jgi:Zn-dependent protease with chaperone function